MKLRFKSEKYEYISQLLSSSSRNVYTLLLHWHKLASGPVMSLLITGKISLYNLLEFLIYMNFGNFGIWFSILNNWNLTLPKSCPFTKNWIILSQINFFVYTSTPLSLWKYFFVSLVCCNLSTCRLLSLFLLHLSIWNWIWCKITNAIA
jgi:hypothetical protein